MVPRVLTAFVLGAGLADPHDAAAHRAQGIIVQNDFDELAAAQMKTAAQAESFFAGIEDQTRKTLLAVVKIDDQTGARFGESALRTAAFGDRQAGHGYTFSPKNSDGRAGGVSFWDPGGGSASIFWALTVRVRTQMLASRFKK